LPGARREKMRRAKHQILAHGSGCLGRPPWTTLLNDSRRNKAPVAQMDRATGFEPVGRGFDSLRAHQPSLTLPGQRELRLASQPSRELATGIRCGHQPAVSVDSEVFTHAPVAQLDRATVSEAVGRRFDSCRAHLFSHQLSVPVPQSPSPQSPVEHFPHRSLVPRLLMVRAGGSTHG
jgi:hypothetical protein